MGRGFSERNEGALYNRSLNKIYAKHINLQAFNITVQQCIRI